MVRLRVQDHDRPSTRRVTWRATSRATMWSGRGASSGKRPVLLAALVRLLPSSVRAPLPCPSLETFGPPVWSGHLPATAGRGMTAARLPCSGPTVAPPRSVSWFGTPIASPAPALPGPSISAQPSPLIINRSASLVLFVYTRRPSGTRSGRSGPVRVSRIAAARPARYRRIAHFAWPGRHSHVTAAPSDRAVSLCIHCTAADVPTSGTALIGWPDLGTRAMGAYLSSPCSAEREIGRWLAVGWCRTLCSPQVRRC